MALENHPDANEYDKQVFRSMSSFGGDVVRGTVIGGSLETGGQILGEMATGGSRVGGEVGKQLGKYTDWLNTGIESSSD